MINIRECIKQTTLPSSEIDGCRATRRSTTWVSDMWSILVLRQLWSFGWVCWSHAVHPWKCVSLTFFYLFYICLCVRVVSPGWLRVRRSRPCQGVCTCTRTRPPPGLTGCGSWSPSRRWSSPTTTWTLLATWVTTTPTHLLCRVWIAWDMYFRTF